MRSATLALALLIGLLAIGCLPSDAPVDDRAMVEHVWRLVDTRYALFADKPDVDWPAARERARAALEQRAPGDEAALFDLIAAMLAELDDQHVNLLADIDVSGDTARNVAYPRLYDAELVERQVLGLDFRRVAGIVHGRLPSGVGYLRLSGFSSVPDDAGLDAVFAALADAPGLIIDLRSNGGGALESMFRLLARLVDEPTAGIRVAFSDGPGHAELTAPEARNFGPAGGPRFVGPTAVLFDRHSYSASNTFGFIARRLPHVITVGQPTGGGGGMPFWFELPNGWLLRLSTGRMTDVDGEGMEPGFTPAVPASLDADLRLQGRDTMIEAAEAVLLERIDEEGGR